MDQAWEDYHHKLRAKMTNLIERYAQPPPQPQHQPYAPPPPPPPPRAATTQCFFPPDIQPSHNWNLEVERVASPALDRVAKNLPEIVIEPLSLPSHGGNSMSTRKEGRSVESSSTWITVCCWILGIISLALLGVAIYFGINMSKMTDNDNEEDEL